MKIQRIILAIGLTLVIFSGLFPPCEAPKFHEWDSFHQGYRFLFAMDAGDKIFTARLVLELITITAATVLAYLLVGMRKK